MVLKLILHFGFSKTFSKKIKKAEKMFCVSDKNIIFKKMFFLMLFTQNE